MKYFQYSYIYCLCVLQDCRKFAQHDLRRSLKLGYAKIHHRRVYRSIKSKVLNNSVSAFCIISHLNYLCSSQEPRNNTIWCWAKLRYITEGYKIIKSNVRTLNTTVCLHFVAFHIWTAKYSWTSVVDVILWFFSIIDHDHDKVKLKDDAEKWKTLGAIILQFYVGSFACVFLTDLEICDNHVILLAGTSEFVLVA